MRLASWWLVLLALPLVAAFMPATLPTRIGSPASRAAVCAVMTELQPGEAGYKRAKFKKLVRRVFQPGKVATEEAEAEEAAAKERRVVEKAKAKKAYEEEQERERVAAEKASLTITSPHSSPDCSPDPGPGNSHGPAQSLLGPWQTRTRA